MSKINITRAAISERDTEAAVREWLNSQNNITAPGGKSGKFTEQYPIGSRRPDFVTCYNKDGDEAFIIIEAKKSDIVAGEKQVKEYMEMVKNSNPETNIIGIAAAIVKNKLKLTAFAYNSDKIISLKVKASEGVEYLVRQTLKDVEGISQKKRKVLSWRELLSKELSQLHNYVRNYCKAPANEKVNLINAVFIALQDVGFREAIEDYEDKNFSHGIHTMLSNVIHRVTKNSDKTAKISNSYAFLNIEAHPTNDPTAVPSYIVNNIKIKEPTLSFNKFVCLYIRDFILKPLEALNDEGLNASDIASVVYNEFIRYAKGDGKDLGIVLTPEHIADLMTDLIDLQPDDVLLDICTGTGAFLISGMKKKIAHSATGQEENKSTNNLVGVEFQPHMYSLAVSNLLFNGADISNLFLGSCFDETNIKQIEALKPTKAILNPPYGMKEKGYNELDFVKHALSFLPKGGKLAVIIPTSCGIKDGIFKEFRDDILENNRLDLAVECNPQLFGDNASVATTIYVFTAGIPHEKSSTLYYNSKKDGYKSGKRGSRLDSSVWENIRQEILKDFEEDEPGENSMHFKTKVGKNWDPCESFELVLNFEDFYEKS